MVQGSTGAANQFVPKVDIQSPITMVSSRTPTYPAAAAQAGVEGISTVRVEVSKGGTVLSAQISKTSGDKSLDGSALSTAKQWRFPTNAGSSGNQVIEVPVKFSLITK
jgi:TonB family protein